MFPWEIGMGFPSHKIVTTFLRNSGMGNSHPVPRSGWDIPFLALAREGIISGHKNCRRELHMFLFAKGIPIPWESGNKTGGEFSHIWEWEYPIPKVLVWDRRIMGFPYLLLLIFVT